MNLPVAAEAIELFEWRTHFGQPPSKVAVSPELREYRSLIHPGAAWMREEDFDRPRDRQQKQAAEYAERLHTTANDHAMLDRWGAWVTEYIDVKREQPWHPTLAMTLEAAARADRAAGVELVDYLITSESPLIGYTSAAMIEALQLDNAADTALRWAHSTSMPVRRALAWAAAGLPDALQRPVLEDLANSPEIDVRRAITQALRYRSGVADWRAGVALQLVAQDGDLRVLVDVLKALADAEAQDLDLTQEHLEIARAAVLKAASEPNANESHEVAEALSALRRLGNDVLWDWVWLRIEWLSKYQSGSGIALPSIPDQVVELVSEHASNEDVEIHLRRALDELDNDVLNFLLQEALILFVNALDDDSRLVTEHLERWASGPEAKTHLVGEILKARAPWDVFTDRARAALAGDGSPAMIDLVVRAREPMSFMGSRVPSYEGAKESFIAWNDDPDGNLVRAALCAAEYFDECISSARTEEEARLNRY
jgi:hypothetical protein